MKYPRHCKLDSRMISGSEEKVSELPDLKPGFGVLLENNQSRRLVSEQYPGCRRLS
jgi:hypothetical protein